MHFTFLFNKQIMSNYHVSMFKNWIIFLYMLLEVLISRMLCQESLKDIFVCHENLF